MSESDSSSSELDNMESNEPIVKHWARTQSKQHKIYFKWTINNFSLRKHSSGECLQSPTFSADTNKEVKWCLRFYPNGIDKESIDYSYIFLRLLSNHSQGSGKFIISILNSSSQAIKIWESKEAIALSEYLEDQYYINRKCLMDHDDILTILCEVFFLTDTVYISSQNKTERFDIPECNLIVDLGNLLDNRKFSDVILVVDDIEFPAHRAILAARSDVFAAMFESEMKECKLGRVTITDIYEEVLQEMLHFIYTGNAPNIKEMAHHLLEVADKYALKKLKVMAEEELFSKISIDTAAETLILSHRHNAHQLKEQTFKFINKHFKMIQETSGWKTVEIYHKDLQIEALKAMVMQKIE